jgi:hypothetical protein
MEVAWLGPQILGEHLTAGAEAGSEESIVIAAVNRCATQKLRCPTIRSLATDNCEAPQISSGSLL